MKTSLLREGRRAPEENKRREGLSATQTSHDELLHPDECHQQNEICERTFL